MTEKENVGSSMVKAVESAAIQLTPGTVKRFIEPKATDQEVALFLNQCVMFGLNPFKREIYLIKYKATDPATFVVGYEVYLKRADRTGKWAGMDATTIDDDKGQLVKAVVNVYRTDWAQPLKHEVFLSEYIQTKEQWVNGAATGKRVPTKFWAEKPRTMLKKVAIAQAMRMAFPDELAGMPYTSEEMPVDHSKLSTVEVVTTADYEASKLKPLGNVRDEWSDPPSDAAGPANVKDPGQRLGAESGQPSGDDKSFGEEIGAETAEGHPSKDKPKDKPTDICSLDQAQAIFDGVAKLAAAGVDEGMVWRSIAKKLREQFNNQAFSEPADLTVAEADWVVKYLARWAKGAEKDGKK